MPLPPPRPIEEDHWLESLLESDASVIVDLALEALENKRIRLAGRLYCLLDPVDILDHPKLQRAKRAALLQLHDGGLNHQEMPEDLETLKRRRKQRMARSKRRQRRSVNPKDPRFRRK